MAPPKRNTSSSATAAAAQSDPRFTSFATDPRYRLPRKKDTHVKLDKRFAHMLRDDDFSRKAKVDRYGRKIPKSEGDKKRKELERLYEVEEDAEEESEDVDEDDDVIRELERVERDDSMETGGKRAKGLEAKYVGYSESSSSEEESEDSSSEEEESVEEDAAVQAGLEGFSTETQDEVPSGEVSSRLAVVNLDWDHIRAVDLMAVAQSFCPKDGSIESVAIYPSEYGRERMEKEELEGPDRELFARSATKNGHRATQPSLLSKGDRAKSRNQQKQPHKFSPAPSSDDFSEGEDPVSDDDEDPNEGPSDDEAIQERLLLHAKSGAPEVDTRALRVYQLSRLRYYYAIISCSTVGTARVLYDSMDGREYLSTANFFDLRFVPDETTFPAAGSGPDAARDVCASVPAAYKPAEFVTEALTHSKVRLTWEEEDRGRQEAQKRAFAQGSGAKGKKAVIEEDDLAAYVGSGSSSDEDGEDDTVGDAALSVAPAVGTNIGALAIDAKAGKKAKAAAARRQMRLALGLPVDDEGENNGDDLAKANGIAPKKSKRTPDAAPQGDMQITFSSALSGGGSKSQVKTQSESKTAKAKGVGSGSVFENTPDDVKEETTRERYIRKERERKARRKERSRQEETDPGADEVDAVDEGGEADAGFDDPFFADPAAANAQAKKESKRARVEQKAADAAAQEQRLSRERRELELVMQEDGGDGGRSGKDFDMAAVLKSEKAARRKGKAKGKKKEIKADEASGETTGMTGKDDFEMDVSDPRFGRVFEDHEFAIDPSNPRFSGTEGMKRLLDEGRKKRQKHIAEAAGDEVDGPGKVMKRTIQGSQDDMSRLLENAKRRRL